PALLCRTPRTGVPPPPRGTRQGILYRDDRPGAILALFEGCAHGTSWRRSGGTLPDGRGDGGAVAGSACTELARGVGRVRSHLDWVAVRSGARGRASAVEESEAGGRGPLRAVSAAGSGRVHAGHA